MFSLLADLLDGSAAFDVAFKRNRGPDLYTVSVSWFSWYFGG